MKLGISTCPNDVFIFAALLSGKVNCSVPFDVFMGDVQELNELAHKGVLDMAKVSYGMMDELMENYRILPAGGAMGFGVGPLIVVREGFSGAPSNLAVPGHHTTALKVFAMCYPKLYTLMKDRIKSVKFDKIMPAVQQGEFDMGIVIHEGRFTYSNYGLKKYADIGEEWNRMFSSPLPLGGIVLKTNMAEYAPLINNLILQSMDYAYSNFDEVLPYITEHADEMDVSVMKQHINLYVNEYSRDAKLGMKGIKSLLNKGADIFHQI